MKEGTSAEQHLEPMKDITDKLAAVGAPISEEDQVVTLLGSLLRSFATLVSAIEARMEGVSLDYVQQALIHEEIKQSELSCQSSGAAESALTGAFRRGTPRDQPTCFECGGVGYIRRYCPRKFKLHKAQVAEGGQRRQENSDIEGEDVYAAAFMMSAGNVKSVDKECYPWVIDSGASSHMTKEKHVLTNYQEFFEPEKCCAGRRSCCNSIRIWKRTNEYAVSSNRGNRVQVSCSV